MVDIESEDDNKSMITVWQYRWKFYLVNKKGRKTLEKESEKWYCRRRDCINASKEAKKRLPILVGDGLKYRGVLVRRRYQFRGIDEVDEKASRSAAERMLTLMYAEKIRQEVDRLSKEKCPACEIDDPSQLHHDCLMLDFSDHMYIHYKEAVDSINDDYILSKWEMYLQTSGLMDKIHPIYLLKYRCMAWLNRDYKTDDWRSHVFKICEEMGKFERVFVL